MRRKIGTVCVALGICCLLAAVGILVHNYREESKAERASKVLLQDVDLASENERILEEVLQEMPTVKVNGYDCIGVLSIPVLQLELPVLTDWTYSKLQIAPCHYYGSYDETDFVIAAHNYKSHFGRLTELQQKDLVLFEDVTGTIHTYEVVLLETLPANATEEMITSGFDLSLYTCTTGGGSRVTVRCNVIND